MQSAEKRGDGRVKSWRKKVIVLLIAILVAVGIFFGWTTYHYSSAIRNSIREENAVSVRLWSNMLETRTGAVNEHITELMYILYNRTMLDFGTPSMDVYTRVAVLDAMSDKLLISEEADAFFIYDIQGGGLLFSADHSVPQQTVADLKESVRQNVEDRAKPFGDTSWDVYEVNGFAYFFKSVQLGKYIVGGVSGCGRYQMEDHVNIFGLDPVCVLQTEEGTFPIGGDPDQARELTAEGLQEGDRNGRVTVVRDVPFLGGQVMISSRPDRPLSNNILTPLLLFLDSVAGILLVMLLLVQLQKNVVRPTRALEEATAKLASGDAEYRLEVAQAGSAEFESLYQSFNNMADQIVDLRIEAYDMKLRDDANRLTMLRAQIKPHSLLNVITTISNMTYTSRNEEIRAYIAAFAKFVRYMLNTSSPWTTVSEELSHCVNYLNMQQTRFPGSIRYTVDCDEEAAPRKMPFLMLFTLVENTIKHAMTLYEPLDVHIICRRVEQAGFSGVSLRVEDSGSGFSAEALERLEEESGQSPYAKEHLGLSNVRYTLNLVYRRNDLLRVGNRPEGGAWVELWIPDEEVTA